MKRTILLAAVAVAAAWGCATVAIEDTQLGLSKTSVFDVVTPAPFDFEGQGAGTTVAPLAGSGMPPMISHSIDDSLPITAKSNDCLGCHDKPANIGKPVAKGKASPAPASHYARAPDGGHVVAGSQYNCIACHAPQSGAQPLVGNTSR